MTAFGDKKAKLVLCDCLGTQKLDPKALSAATGLNSSSVYTHLCGAQAAQAAGELAGDDVLVCCGQEQNFFEELAIETDAPTPFCIDIRDRAGWSDDQSDSTPKMAALIAEAALPSPGTKTVDVMSEGLCLIIGKGDVAFRAADRLKDILGVTVLVTDDAEPPTNRSIDVIRGKIRHLRGALGGFEVSLDALQRVEPGGRGGFTLTEPRDDATTECDIVLDLSGTTALVTAPGKREGYLKADPGSISAVGDAIFDAAQLIGTFEKPLYVKQETALCAHSRAEQTACNKCLDVCPTGAIISAGDHVAIDPMVCAGCGSCAAVCPSGAISYDAPPAEQLFRRIQTLAQTYIEAGGATPRLLVTDDHGAEMVRLLARFSTGLPSDVIPLELSALNTFGHAEAVAALAAGFVHVSLLVGPDTERDTAASEIALANAISGSDAVALLDIADPDILGAALRQTEARDPVASPVRPMGTRRQITRQAARALHPETESLSLPDGAPYGAVLVDTDACTLCLSCASLCPTGALGDNPDLPQLRFQEDACLQCGLCANLCPEDAISYEPRLNLTETALAQTVLNEEEPFACVECGSLFGSKSTIERITEKLSGHAMYQDEGALRMIQMCDDCRVNAQFHSKDNPFAGAERPRPRTTDDYFSKRRDH